jgi:hypothetical protein
VKGVNPDDSSDCWKIVGPGYQDFRIPVSAVSTTVSVDMRFDGTYGTSVGKPTVEVLANAEIGVASTVTTMTEAANTKGTKTVNFTPTAKGVVTIRVRSRDSNGAGALYFDAITVT